VLALFAEQFFLSSDSPRSWPTPATDSLIRVASAPIDDGATTVAVDPDSPTWYPRFAEVVFPHQSQQQSASSASNFCFLTRLALISAGIADPQLETKFCQQPLDQRE